MILKLLSNRQRYGQYFERLALQEELKSMPWQAVWDYYCILNDVPVGENYISEIQKYEQTVTSKR
jgi:L-rhamnose isomerase